MMRRELAAILHPEVVKPQLGATNRYDAVQELLDLMVHSHDLSTRQLARARDATFRAVRRGTTSRPSGAAVSWVTMGELATPVAALGLSREGIDFGGQPPSRLILVLIFPRTQEGYRIPLVERLRSERSLITDLTEAETSKELYRKLKDLEG